VRERAREEVAITEGVADPFLECAQVRHLDEFYRSAANA
jgi:hypothetical protein